MYSGTTLTRMSGRLIGAHQNIDRVARRHLGRVLKDDKIFPSVKKILQFEGKNGPDAIKRKSPAKDEPWHYTNPFDDEDTQLEELIRVHYDHLVNELKTGNSERIAFEAAWLAHAIVDGLTPAHHYPYEQKLTELRGGQGIESRTNYRKKLIMPGATKTEMVKNNWKMWGPRGLIMSHMMFEFGVAAIIAPLGFGEAKITRHQIKTAKEIGLIQLFRWTSKEIAVLDMYENFHKKGWTPKLAWQVRHRLGPNLVQTVALGWYLALYDAGLAK